jgi:hypothetical protein
MRGLPSSSIVMIFFGSIMADNFLATPKFANISECGRQQFCFGSGFTLADPIFRQSYQYEQLALILAVG